MSVVEESGESGDEGSWSTRSDLLGEAQRAISRQEANLDSLRDRAGRLIGASSVVAGLFVLATRDVECWQNTTRFIALALGLAVIVVMLIIEWPRKFTFEKEIIEMIKDLRGEGTGVYKLSNATLALALGLAEAHKRNEPRIAHLMTWYTVGVGLVLAQILFWFLTAI